MTEVQEKDDTLEPLKNGEYSKATGKKRMTNCFPSESESIIFHLPSKL